MRKKGTGTVVFRDGGYVAFAPQRGGKFLRVAKKPTRSAAAKALDAWLNESGSIVHRDLKPAKICRRETS
jgi:hypothetical protein